MNVTIPEPAFNQKKDTKLELVNLEDERGQRKLYPGEDKYIETLRNDKHFLPDEDKDDEEKPEEPEEPKEQKKEQREEFEYSWLLEKHETL